MTERLPQSPPIMGRALSIFSFRGKGGLNPVIELRGKKLFEEFELPCHTISIGQAFSYFLSFSAFHQCNPLPHSNVPQGRWSTHNNASAKPELDTPLVAASAGISDALVGLPLVSLNQTHGAAQRHSSSSSKAKSLLTLPD